MYFVAKDADAGSDSQGTGMTWYAWTIPDSLLWRFLTKRSRSR